MTLRPVAARVRCTLAQPTARFPGVGLHSGLDSSVQIVPAPSGKGLVFVDEVSMQEIPALVQNLKDTTRCTQLCAGTVTVQTVEHVLSALAALGIDDAYVRYSGPELPAADGSALPFVELLRSAGVQEQADGARVQPIFVDRPRLISGENGSAILALPSAAFHAMVVLDYPNHPYLGTQTVEYDSLSDDYTTDIAPARTYGFRSEIDYLRSKGLALGASEKNALVLGESEYLTECRFPEELARHKLLDLIGDLALAGGPVCARFIAIKPSHALNTTLAAQLAKEAVSAANH